MPQPLAPSTIALVKATVPALEQHGLTIVREMYARMFENPEIRDLFNQSHHGDGGSQPRALAAAVLAYASNIDNLGALAPAVERIAQKHVALRILPEHYPYVGEALLGAIRTVLGAAASDEIMAAWAEAYWFLADVLIAREDRLYTEQRETKGGWNGWRDFRVDRVVEESSVIKSFVLRPVDGGPVMDHKPGQYLTFWVDLPGHGALKRNYSISAAPDGESYRITVKREPLGVVSGWLHDSAVPGTMLSVSAPAGEFYLADHVDRPVVLLSGGVGLTPMIAMLEALVAREADVPVHYVHGTHNRDTHAMSDHVRALAARGKAVRVADFHQTPLPDEIPGRDYDEAGLITEDWLIANTPVAKADYYICGPRPFLRAAVASLSLAGVAGARIHYEYFGPADELLAA